MSLQTSYKSHKVWSRFTATRKDGSVLKLRIQDLPWGKHREDVIEFYMTDFIKDEIFHKVAGIHDSEEATKEYKETLLSYYDVKQPHVSICCVDDDSDRSEILGMSLLLDMSEEDEKNGAKFKPKTKGLQNLIRIYSVIANIKASKGFESYYDGRGVVVRPDYRGLGIANEFIRLRKQICIDHDIPMTTAWMTALPTQIAGAKNNWRLFIEMPVEEVEKRTGLPFDVNVSTFKLMYVTKE